MIFTSLPHFSYFYQRVIMSTIGRRCVTIKSDRSNLMELLSKNDTENVKNISNENLSDLKTIPGFIELAHSPPRDRTCTPRNSLIGMVRS